MPQALNLIFGVARLGNAGSMGIKPEDASEEVTLSAFSILKKYNVMHLDTGRLYGAAETGLGRLHAGTEFGFAIDTKWLGGFFDPASTSKTSIISDAKDSLSKLAIPKIHTFYLHTPAGLDILEKEETLEGVHEVFKLGIFKHFGLSNFSPTQVQHVCDVCKDKGFVLPTVYEGLYNPVNRLPEEELFPLLRKLGIAFNAYSVLAGGFLTKSRLHIINGEGRFAKDQYRGLYGEQYNNEAFLQALEDWGAVAEEEGVTKASLAHRWAVHHSALKSDLGDGILLGGRLSQLEETLEGIERGPLSARAVKRIQELWERLKPSVKYENNLQAMVVAAAKGQWSDKL